MTDTRTLSHYGQQAVLMRFGMEAEPVEAREILLPLPPSENKRLMPGQNFLRGAYAKSKRAQKFFSSTPRSFLYNSKEYSRYLAAATNLLAIGQFPPLECEVAVFVTFCFPDHRRRDPQNYEKAFFDVLTKSGRVYKDDCQVTLHMTDRIIVKDMSFCVAFVLPLSDLPEMNVRLSEEYKARVIEKVEKIGWK